MARVKVQLAPRYAPLDAGTLVAGYPIVQTVPGGVHAIIELPGISDPATIEPLMQDWLARGIIEDDGHGLWRYEHVDYTTLGFPSKMLTPPTLTWYAPVGSGTTLMQPLSYAPGDTFVLCGVTEDTRRRGRWGAGVLVGLCDTGVDGSHPWFAGKTLEGATGDSHGHGTHVAGTILGAEGIAPDAALYVQTVLPGGQGTESGIAAGIRACADRGCHVVNLSLGGSVSSVMDDACTYARNRGVVVCAAAGNGGGQPIGSPARAASVIVMAYDRQRIWATFTDGRDWTNPNRVGAPGVDIVSAAPGGGTRQMSGTSMACPHVVGCAALLIGAGLPTLPYLTAHRTAAPDTLALMLEPDFGRGPVTPPDWQPQVDAHLQEMEDLVTQAQNDRCSWAASLPVYQTAMAQIMDHDIGPIRDVVQQIRALLPKA